MKYNNPVIPGSFTDPSICRVGDDYYLVNGSFEYFPGVPISHSKDLVHWRQIGYCLTRPSQLNLHQAKSAQGIYAPTLRYDNGTFYMITTNTSHGGTFYVFTDDPTSEWSDPIWIDQPGIDPSLLFDDDGKVYVTSTGMDICQSEIDIKTGQRLTEVRKIWSGTGGRFAEGPHLYKINSVYYLMIAEGGSEYGHMEVIARSDIPWGPFEACPHNPILTHRNLGMHPIQGLGHADLIRAQDDSWWMVFLAFRPNGLFFQFHHLGRETYLAPVTWRDDGWPYVGDNGTINLEMDVAHLPATHEWPTEPTTDDFEQATLDKCWNFLRNPYPKDWSLGERPGWLRLHGSAVTLSDIDSPAFVARRQQHFDCQIRTWIDFMPAKENEEAGLTLYMNDGHHYELAISLRQQQRIVFVRRRIGDLTAIVAQAALPEGIATLEIKASAREYTFSFAHMDAPFHTLATGATRYLAIEVTGGFNGVYVGMYATGNGQVSTCPADFDRFDYIPLE